MKKLILLVMLISGVASAQTKIVQIYGDDAYYEISEHKVKFYLRYTPDEEKFKLEHGYAGILNPSTILHADVHVEGDYVVAQRIKAVQQTGYKFTIHFEDLLSHKVTNRKGKVKPRFRRWTDMLIGAIKRY